MQMLAKQKCGASASGLESNGAKSKEQGMPRAWKFAAGE